MSNTLVIPPARPAADPAALIVLAGATGEVGLAIAQALRQRGAPVRALVRPGNQAPAHEALRMAGVELVEVDFGSVAALMGACLGASCVVSALSGLRDVIIDGQRRLLAAAVAAGVPRFIPSDYSADYTTLPAGANRNLDLRREFGH